MKWLALLTMLTSVNAVALTINEEAKTHIKKAILAMPKVRQAKKTVEKKAIKAVLGTGVTKEQVSTALAITKSLADGQVSTEYVKTSTRFLGGRMTPDASYNWKTKAAKAVISIGWTWP